jgi:hypothetical protein
MERDEREIIHVELERSGGEMAVAYLKNTTSIPRFT